MWRRRAAQIATEMTHSGIAVEQSREYLKHIGIASLRESSESGGGDVVNRKFGYLRHRVALGVVVVSHQLCYLESLAATLGLITSPCLALASRWLPASFSPNSSTANWLIKTCLVITWHPNRE